MNESRAMSLVGKTIIGQHGREIGVITDMFVDVVTWQLQSLEVKLNRETLDDLRLKRPWFRSQTVHVPVREISGATGGVAPGFSRQGTGRLGRALAEVRKEKSVAPKKLKTPKKKKDHLPRRWRDGNTKLDERRRARALTTAAVAQKTAKKKTRKRGSPELIPHPVSRPDSARLGRAKAAAQLSRIKRSGLDSRVRGHVSAKGKRAQARRDSKNS